MLPSAVSRIRPKYEFACKWDRLDAPDLNAAGLSRLMIFARSSELGFMTAWTSGEPLTWLTKDEGKITDA